ncbi:MAG: rod shape-determining protein RodA [Oceanococcus sp.]
MNLDGGSRQNNFWTQVHLDVPLLLLLLLLTCIGLVTVYSATGEDMQMVIAQSKRIAIGMAAMILVAQCPPEWFRTLTPWAYLAGSAMLVAVLLLGDSSKGAQRWLDFGFIRFQPSELMKFAVPLMVASFLHERRLPPALLPIAVCVIITCIPTALIIRQPDLGTSLLVISSGAFALYFAGLRWRVILGALALAGAAAPVLWHNMRDYQKQRVMTLLDPASDPSGAGYHIIQSKIAIGSGGWDGKGWLQGTQARLDFLPEANTDFIFAVFAEEFGLWGVLGLLMIYLLIASRGLYIAYRAQDTFSRLVCASLSLTFFIYLFVNIGMVIGLLPVVGVPLPLVSYGGTSMVTLLASFGLIMSIHTHRKLLTA